MNQKITLYHGSEQIVESPTFGLGKQNNDFGLGFTARRAKSLPKNGLYPLCAAALPTVIVLTRNI